MRDRLSALLLPLLSVLIAAPAAHGQSTPVPTAAAAATPAILQRHALVIGANDGGGDRPRLRYAVSDARRFAEVMVELGGVAPANQTVLTDPSIQELFDALDALGRQLIEARDAGGARVGRTEVILYYSGHADEKGLLLGEDRVSYLSLRDRLDELPADVRIAVLDACASGAFTRLKGGTARRPFIVDASSAMRGHAFLTSSAATEAAQESDRIGASYFTHYLVSGFRGAADLSRDGRVTLSEAYQFAFAETVGRTIGTSGGAQHPSYDINLSGTGDVVMTDVRQTTSGLVLAEAIDGRVFIRDDARRLVLELHKTRGQTVVLALEPGLYDVSLDRRGGAAAARVDVRGDQPVTLEAGAFTPVPVETTRSRGTDWPGHAVAGRTAVSLVNGLWGDRGFVLDRFDLFGGLRVTRHLTERWALEAGVDAYGADADQDIIGGLAIPLTLRWTVGPRPASRRLKPFVSGGAVVVTRGEGGSLGRLSTLGLQIGSGVDVRTTRALTFTVRGAYNIVPAFGGPTWPGNYDGLQLSIGAGWLFGRPR